MITSINKFNETLLVPRNIDGRKDKLKQNNFNLLQQETIDGNLTIDESFLFDFDFQVKTKQINGNVAIQLGYIPLWLENIIINGLFDCARINLTTLKGCPKKINGSFLCDNNELTSLEYGPEYVGDSYWCNRNKLTTLKGCPKKINGSFVCDNNNLTSLEYGPEFINGSRYNCDRNKLTTLKGCPKKINGSFDCSNNELESLEYGPEYVGRIYFCNANKTKFTKQYVESLCDGTIRILC